MTTGLLDTSFVVRYLTDDQPDLADRATRVIEGPSPVAISPVAVVEAAHVLTKVYRLERARVVDALVSLLQRDNVHAVGPSNSLLIEALMLCRPSGRVSFADAAIWAEARWTGMRKVFSFDRRFPSEGIELDRGD